MLEAAEVVLLMRVVVVAEVSERLDPLDRHDAERPCRHQIAHAGRDHNPAEFGALSFAEGVIEFPDGLCVGHQITPAKMSADLTVPLSQASHHPWS